jgi:hypothetical protein
MWRWISKNAVLLEKYEKKIKYFTSKKDQFDELSYSRYASEKWIKILN